MTGAALLHRIAEAGAAASLDPDGRVRIAGASRLPAWLLDLLRQHREAVAEALGTRGGQTSVADEAPAEDPAETAERTAMAEHFAPPPEARPWRPCYPDPLGAGLLAGRRASSSGRLAGLSERLEAARPRPDWGVSQTAWRIWETTAREAAGLSDAEWSAWRAEAAGVRLRPRLGSGVRLEADAPPPPEVLEELRQHRDAVTALVAERTERAAFYGRLAAAQPAETRGHYGEPVSPAAHQAVVAGHWAATPLQRPPAWPDVSCPPPPGAWCSCCGRSGRRGGRWWREHEAPRGWRCWTCHPPDHLPAEAVREVRT